MKRNFHSASAARTPSNTIVAASHFPRELEVREPCIESDCTTTKRFRRKPRAGKTPGVVEEVSPKLSSLPLKAFPCVESDRLLHC